MRRKNEEDEEEEEVPEEEKGIHLHSIRNFLSYQLVIAWNFYQL